MKDVRTGRQLEEFLCDFCLCDAEHFLAVVTTVINLMRLSSIMIEYLACLKNMS